MDSINKYYSNSFLKKKIKELEDSIVISDEENFFKSKVNTSESKNYPFYRWNRYREGYSGDLVKELIDRSNLDPAKHFIVDPMCGSGSTQIAASELGFDSLGLDVNQYAVDLSNAKFLKFNTNEIKSVKNIVTDIVNKNLHIKLSDESENQKYFTTVNYTQIRNLYNIVSSQSNVKVKKLLLVAWLSILEDCSERKKDGNGLATRPSKIVDVAKHFQKQVNIMLEDIEQVPLNIVHSKSLKESATNTCQAVTEFAKETKKQLGAVIFSPPYANSFDYFESYKLELLCGYYSQNELIEARKLAIRNYRKGYGKPLSTGNKIIELLTLEVKDKIPEKERILGKPDNRSRLVPNLLIGYFEDMEKVILEFSKCMPAQSKCYIVVDQSSYLGVIIPTDLLLVDIARKHEFKVNRLIRCRRAATSAQQLKSYPYLRTALRESIIVLEK